MNASTPSTHREPWNKGKLVGQKAPFKLKEIWAIRVRLQLQHRARDLALFNLGIDSKLRACDLVRLHVRDVCHGSAVASRAIVMQQKTERPVQFEITAPTRDAVAAWIERAESDDPAPSLLIDATSRLPARTWRHCHGVSWAAATMKASTSAVCGPKRCEASSLALWMRPSRPWEAGATGVIFTPRLKQFRL